jgi:hypothetical protein
MILRKSHFFPPSTALPPRHVEFLTMFISAWTPINGQTGSKQRPQLLSCSRLHLHRQPAMPGCGDGGLNPSTEAVAQIKCSSQMLIHPSVGLLCSRVLLYCYLSMEVFWFLQCSAGADNGCDCRTKHILLPEHRQSDLLLQQQQ